MTKTRVFSIVLNYNRPKETLNCVASLNKQTGSFKHSIVVVNNSPKSHNNLIALNNQSNVFLIQNKKNLGFAGGNNRGIKYALEQGANYVCLVNDDAYLSKDCLKTLIGFMEKNKKVAIVSPKIYFAPGFEYHQERYLTKEKGKVIWYAGGIIDWQNILASHKGVNNVDKGQYNKQEETDFATGCVMLIKASVFSEIGFFDENYLMYWEDVDFCQRAKEKKLKVFFVGQAKAWHKNLGTQKKVLNKQKEKYMARSRLRFGLKYASLKLKLLLLKEHFFNNFLLKQ